MLCFSGNICSTHFEVWTKVSAYPFVAIQNIIKCSVLFLWKLFFFSLHAFCITEAFQNFSGCFDIHNGTAFVFNTNFNAKILSHYHAIIMNLTRIIAANIWNRMSSNSCVGGINLNQCYLRIFHPIAIMQLYNALKRSSPSTK